MSAAPGAPPGSLPSSTAPAFALQPFTAVDITLPSSRARDNDSSKQGVPSPTPQPLQDRSISSSPVTEVYETRCLPVSCDSFPPQASTATGSFCQDPPGSSDGQDASVRPSPSAAAPQPSSSDQDALQSAADLLRCGLPVAIPTETVYGLAANALSAEAVSRVFAAKGRPPDNPLIVHVSSLAMLEQLYPAGWALPPQYAPLAAAFWPGPLTMLLPRSPLVPDVVTAGQATMAVRMPSHPVARALIELCGFPLAAPSANLSGRPSPTTAQHVMTDLAGRVPLVLDGGPCSSGVESTVVDAMRVPPAILRPGGVTWEQLRDMPGMEGLRVYSKHFVDAALEEAPSTPGMKYRHYSPNALVVLLDIEGCNGPPAELRRRLRAASASVLAQLAARGVQRATLLRTSVEAGCAAGDASQSTGQPALLAPAPLTSTASRVAASLGAAIRHHPTISLEGLGLPLPAADGALGDGTSTAGCTVSETILGSLDEPWVVARSLFSALRSADEACAEVVVVEGVREDGAGLAVLNRLRKAASCVLTLAPGSPGR